MMNRRRLFQNISASCLLYPLSGVLTETQAFGAENTAKKALFLFYPDGSIANAFFPTDKANFPIITSPLQGWASDLSFVRGLEYLTSGSHEGGAQFCFTGTKDSKARYSIDSFLGDRLGQDSALKCLRLGVASGFQSGTDKAVSYLASGAAAVVEDHPKKAFYSIFASDMDPDEKAKVIASDQSVLDFSLEQLKLLNNRLGSIEKDKLDNHLTALRELERQIQQKGDVLCNLAFDDRGINFPERETKYPPTHQINDHFGRISDLMTDIMVEALHCGVTNVGLLQWSHAVSPTQFDFFGGPALNRGHHDMSHYGGDENGAIAQQFKEAQRWYSLQMAKLFQKLKDRKIGDKTLWDSTVVLATTELGDSNLHNFKQVPCLLAGAAGGSLKQGQLLQKNTSYNHLLTTVVQAMGIDQDFFGDAKLGQGPIAELLA